MQYCIHVQGKFHARFIFTLMSEGELRTVQIEPEWGCPNGTNTPRGNQFKLSKLFIPISLEHILDSQV